MKNLYLTLCCIFCFFIISCSEDDDSNNDITIEGTGLIAQINGGTFSNYNFEMTVYNVVKNGDTMEINAGDVNGDQITLALNATNGFNDGSVKEMGNQDSNNSVTYILIRQSSSQLWYYANTSGSGTVTITQNIAHPTEANKKLISGNFNVTGTVQGTGEVTSMSGSFAELEYVD